MPSSRVRREPTSANSAATKNAFNASNTTTAASPARNGTSDDVSICGKTSGPSHRPRGQRMIRQLAVPPFDRLDPFLPKVSVSDAATRAGVAQILEDVAARGDVAVRHWTRKFDGVDLAPAQWAL